MADSRFVLSPELLEYKATREALLKDLRTQCDRVEQQRSKKSLDVFDEFLTAGPTDNVAASGPSNSQTLMKASRSLLTHLATINATTRDSIVQQIKSTNLSKFLVEAAKSAIQSRIGHADLLAFTEVIALLHITYPGWMERFMPKLNEELSSEDVPLPRKRNLLRIYGDLLICHATTNAKDLYTFIHRYIGMDITSGIFTYHEFIWGILTYNGGDLLGVNHGPKSVVYRVFTDEGSLTPLRKDIAAYYNKMIATLKEKAAIGFQAHKEAEQILVMKGIANSGKAELAAKMQTEYNQVRTIAQCYAFLMKKPIPEDANWIEDKDEKVEVTNEHGGVIIVNKKAATKMNAAPLQAFEMEEFYIPINDLEKPPSNSTYSQIEQIKKALDQASQVDRIDDLSRNYFVLDNEEIRTQMSTLIGSISKHLINQAPYYARFVANVSTKFPDFGASVAALLEKAFTSFITKMTKSDRAIFSPKLHIARYIAELAKFKIGIDQYFHCLSYTVNNFRGRTIDMGITLIIGAGHFLDSLADTTHIQMRNLIEKIKQHREESSFQPHVKLLVTQAIELIEGTPEAKGGDQIVPTQSKYQAFINYVFQSMLGEPQFAKKAKKFVDKCMQTPDSGVDLNFLIQVCFDLCNFRSSELHNLAHFISLYSTSSAKFTQMYCDILIERIRRGIEINNPSFRLQQILEVRLMALLIKEGVLKIDHAIGVIRLILSCNQPNPRNFLIQIQGRKSRLIESQAGFFRAVLVINIIDILVPILIRQPPETHNQFHQIFLHLQLFCLIRAPIPPDVAFQLTDLLEKCDKYKVPSVQWYETIEQCKPEAQQIEFRTGSPYAFFPNQHGRTDQIHDIKFDKDSDDDEPDEDEEQIENDFERERREFLDECAKEKVQRKPAKSGAIPMELLTSKAPDLENIPKLSAFTAPPGFVVVVKKPGKGNESIDVELPPSRP